MKPLRIVVAGVLVALGCAGSADARGVSLATAQRYAHRTYINDPSLGRRTFTARYRRVVTAADGSTITGVGATLSNSGDGTGQIVLLFRGARFLGWESAFAALHSSLSARGSSLVVRYGVYSGRDAFCCPHAVKSIAFRWNGRRIVASGTPPRAYGRRGPRLHLG